MLYGIADDVPQLKDLTLCCSMDLPEHGVFTSTGLCGFDSKLLTKQVSVNTEMAGVLSLSHVPNAVHARHEAHQTASAILSCCTAWSTSPWHGLPSVLAAERTHVHIHIHTNSPAVLPFMPLCVPSFKPGCFWLGVRRASTSEQAEERQDCLEGSAECPDKSDGDMATSQVSIDRTVMHVSWTQNGRHRACLLSQDSCQAGWQPAFIHTAVTMDDFGYRWLCAYG